MMAALTNPLAPFPRVMIDGEEFELRYTPRSTYFIESSNQIGKQEVREWLAAQFEAKHTESAIMIMMASMLGHEVEFNGKLRWRAMPITGLELSERASLAEWNAMAGAYAEAMGKAAEAMKAATQRLQELQTPAETASPAPVIN